MTAGLDASDAQTAEPELTLRLTAKTRATILAALAEAAEAKHDLAQKCGCGRDGWPVCETCQARHQAADDYYWAAGSVQEGSERRWEQMVKEADPDAPVPYWPAMPAPDREAGQ